MDGPLVDAKLRASDKNLPVVCNCNSFLLMKNKYIAYTQVQNHHKNLCSFNSSLLPNESLQSEYWNDFFFLFDVFYAFLDSVLCFNFSWHSCKIFEHYKGWISWRNMKVCKDRYVIIHRPSGSFQVLLSYCGLVHAKIRASEVLPVICCCNSFLLMKIKSQKLHRNLCSFNTIWRFTILFDIFYSLNLLIH